MPGPGGSVNNPGCFSVVVLVILCWAVGFFLDGCSPTAAPEPRIVTTEVPRIVEVKCKDQRPAADTYPDRDDALANIPGDDFETLAKAYRAGRDLRDARLLLDDVQIRSCAGD